MHPFARLQTDYNEGKHRHYAVDANVIPMETVF